MLSLRSLTLYFFEFTKFYYKLVKKVFKVTEGELGRVVDRVKVFMSGN